MQPDSRHINQLLEDPRSIVSADIVDLQFWAIEYPQVPLFRVLLAKKAMEANYDNSLQYKMEAAAMVSNRSILYKILETNVLNTNISTEYTSITDPVSGNEHADSEIVSSAATIEVLEESGIGSLSPEEEVADHITDTPQANLLPEESVQETDSIVEEQLPQAITIIQPTDESNIDNDLQEVIHAPQIEKPFSAADQLISTLLAKKEPEVSQPEALMPHSDELVPDSVLPLSLQTEELPGHFTSTTPEVENIETEIFDLTGKETKPIQNEPPHVTVPDTGLHSFIEWLDLVDKKNQEGAEVRTPVKEDWIEAPAVDYFPKLNDEIPPVEEVVNTISTTEFAHSPDAEEHIETPEPAGEEEKEVVKQAQLSLEFSENLMTETLARLFVKQGKKAKALKIYKALALHNPEKSSYFAALIQQLEES